MSVCLYAASRGFALPVLLNGSRSFLRGRLLGIQETLCEVGVLMSPIDLMQPLPNWFGDLLLVVGLIDVLLVY